MVEFVRIISEKNNFKKPEKNEKNIFTLYSPKKEIMILKFQSNYQKIHQFFL